jgi:CyaY protein
MDPTPLSDSDYHRLVSDVLARVEASVDRLLQDDVIDIDTNRTGSLLELGFVDGSKIVINTQPPLHELWLASRAAGYHFKYVDGQWREREGREFFEVLSDAATAQGGKAVSFSA